MKRIFLYTILGLFWTSVHAQTSKFPYPVIFLHGLVSSDETWNSTVTALGGGAKVYDFCLNHDGNNTTVSLTSSDAYPIGWRDGNSTPSPNRLYVMNFDDSRFQASGHTSHTLSNQAAIYKQGIALKAMIQAVLDIESCSKVMLVGHSMGGLEIREYLQRGFDGTSSGRGTNWVDQSSLSGHHVARVVTTGTPHMGSNHSGPQLAGFAGIDEQSEAVRDLRYSFTMSSPPYTVSNGPFLFGASESSIPAVLYTKDVNCNGSVGDVITGLNVSGGTTFNSTMPLPSNIRYTWITSNYAGTNQDGLVETARQWLSSSSTPTPATADTVLLGIQHIDQPAHLTSILRGLDEPSDTAHGYELTAGEAVKGYVTHGMNWTVLDLDYFKFTTPEAGSINFSITGSSSGIDSLIVSDASTIIEGKAVGDGTSSITVNGATAGKVFYIKVRGTATTETYSHPYSISAPFTPLPVELSTFTARLDNGKVVLSWRTATEVNNYGFEILRSTQKDDWHKIGFVQGHGTTNAPQSYRFVDIGGWGKVSYRLNQIDRDGKFELSNVVEVKGETISNYSLDQNHPNPFNPTTTISYHLPLRSYVTLKVYDMLGKEIAILVNGVQEAGQNVAEFEAVDLSSGEYFYTIRAGNFIDTKKMILLK